MPKKSCQILAGSSAFIKERLLRGLFVYGLPYIFGYCSRTGKRIRHYLELENPLEAAWLLKSLTGLQWALCPPASGFCFCCPRCRPSRSLNPCSKR